MARIVFSLLILVFVSGILFLVGANSVSSQVGRTYNAVNYPIGNRPANTTQAATNAVARGANVQLQLIEQLAKDDESVRDILGQEGFGEGGTITLERLTKEITFRQIDLNSDRVSEWILEASFNMGFCGSGGCSMWIYSKKGESFHLLLNADTTGSIRKSRTKTRGYFDVIRSVNSGAQQTYVHTYKYDGSAYTEASCFLRSYLDDRGNIQKRPRIMSCR